MSISIHSIPSTISVSYLPNACGHILNELEHQPFYKTGNEEYLKGKVIYFDNYTSFIIFEIFTVNAYKLTYHIPWVSQSEPVYDSKNKFICEKGTFLFNNEPLHEYSLIGNINLKAKFFYQLYEQVFKRLTVGWKRDNPTLFRNDGLLERDIEKYSFYIKDNPIEDEFCLINHLSQAFKMDNFVFSGEFFGKLKPSIYLWISNNYFKQVIEKYHFQLD
ncbi:MAG: hypothetical protein BGO10_06825 [Chlamydia sp. 32-24]|nr:MAG: hypothetical protein BGO10_06825 [Chlamydia sp. 32-24]